MLLTHTGQPIKVHLLLETLVAGSMLKRMERKKKKCVICGNYRVLFSKGRCFYCTPKKPIKTKKKFDKKLREKDHDFYNEIWDERPHVCGNCGQFLGNEPLTLFFDHILEKSKYPEYRHNKDNIWLLCWQCHTNKTNGIYSNVMKDKIKEVEGILLNERTEGQDTTRSSGDI